MKIIRIYNNKFNLNWIEIKYLGITLLLFQLSFEFMKYLIIEYII